MDSKKYYYNKTQLFYSKGIFLIFTIVGISIFSFAGMYMPLYFIALISIQILYMLILFYLKWRRVEPILEFDNLGIKFSKVSSFLGWQNYELKFKDIVNIKLSDQQSFHRWLEISTADKLKHKLYITEIKIPDDNLYNELVSLWNVSKNEIEINH